MEFEDDQGISRKRKASSISINTFLKIKIGLIISIPVIYFVYSPLLILVAAGYFALYFIAKYIENCTNGNLQKKYHIKINKYDSVIMMVVVAITIVGILLSVSTSSMRSSMFEGLSDSEIAEKLEEMGMSSAQAGGKAEGMGGNGMTQSMRLVINGTTLMTGQTVLFQSRNNVFSSISHASMSPPEGASTDSGMDFIREIPFSQMFSNIAVAINTVLIFVSGISGLFTYKSIKRMQ